MSYFSFRAKSEHPRSEYYVDRARKLLRVSKDATQQEIRSSFRKVSLTMHPDKNSDKKANELFPEIYNAKEFLLDTGNLDFFTELEKVDRAREFLRVSKDATKDEIKNSFSKFELLNPDETSETLDKALKARELLMHHFIKEFRTHSKIFAEPFERIEEWLRFHEDDSKLLKTAITYSTNGRTNFHFILERDPPIGIIQKLIEYAPEVLIMGDDLYRLPIHTACGRGRLASFDVIQALVKGYPESVEKTDKIGCLPLHYAIGSQASLSIVSFLIDSYPEGILKSFRYPPSECRRRPPLYFLKIYNYVQMKDRKGMLLLHRACKMNEFSADLVCVLDEAYPESWTIQDNYGKTPKQYLIESARRRDERGMVLLHRQAAHIKGLSVRSLNILHDAYPEAIQMQDSSGLLPIHHASLNEASSLDVLMLLLKLYPESIKGSIAENEVRNNSELGDIRADLALIKTKLEQIRQILEKKFGKG
jgi:ankyrin repeat protein